MGHFRHPNANQMAGSVASGFDILIPLVEGIVWVIMLGVFHSIRLTFVGLRKLYRWHKARKKIKRIAQDQAVIKNFN